MSLIISIKKQRRKKNVRKEMIEINFEKCQSRPVLKIHFGIGYRGPCRALYSYPPLFVTAHWQIMDKQNLFKVQGKPITSPGGT